MTRSKIQYFIKPREGGKPFSFDRPSFNAGEFVESLWVESESGRVPKGSVPKLRPHNRIGDKSDFLRPSFLEDSIKPRTVSFEGDPLKSVKPSVLNGTYVIVRDITDLEWTAEKTRLRNFYRPLFNVGGRTADVVEALIDRELDINKPLGRDQKMIRKLSEDIATQKDMDQAQKFQAILAEVQAGRAESIAQRQGIIAQLLQVLGNIGGVTRDLNALQLIFQNNQASIERSIKQLNLPTGALNMNLNISIVGRHYVQANISLLTLHILNNAVVKTSGTYDINSPLRLTDGTPIKLNSGFTKINYNGAVTGKSFLDVDNCVLLTKNELLRKLRDAKTSGIKLTYNINFTEEVFDGDVTNIQGYLEKRGYDFSDDIDLDTTMIGSSSSSSSTPQSSSSSSSSSPQSSSSSSSSPQSSSSLSSFPPKVKIPKPKPKTTTIKIASPPITPPTLPIRGKPQNFVPQRPKKRP